MSSDVRNIRSHYYKKVGFHGVEEKKTLETLLKETALDLDKLKHYCSKFPVTSDKRLMVWKIVLEVLPRFTTSHEFVAKQRKEQYGDLSKAVEVIGPLPKEYPLCKKFVWMWGVESRKWSLDATSWLSSPAADNMEKISKSLLAMFPGNEVDCYWLAKNLMTYRVAKIEKHIQAYSDLFWNLLEKEDHELHSHLATLRKGSQLATMVPLENWFTSLFADMLHTDVLQRIWDRIIGGHEKSVVYVAMALVIRHRMALLQCNKVETVQETLQKSISESLMTSDEALNQCIFEVFELIGDYGS